MMINIFFRFIFINTITLVSSHIIYAASNSTTVGELEIQHQDGHTKQALLLETKIQGQVTGMVASIQVVQTFKNNSDDWVNGRYVFPLAEGAAVDSLTIKIGERIIQGVIKEKQEAKKVFTQAKQAGKKAGLLEQHRPNLFSISLANIGPHETITAELTYLDKVGYQNEQFSLRLPTTLTPRYIPGSPLPPTMTEELTLTVDSKTGWARNTNFVKDASTITPPQVHQQNLEESVASNQFSLELLIDAGLPLQQVQSDSHLITTTETPNQATAVQLTNHQEAMDSDLIVRWQPVMGNAPKAALFQQQGEQGYYSMLMVMPPTPNTQHSLPRDVTFIIDSSGSMAGSSMTQAQQSLHDALTYLSVNDRFNIIDFDSNYHPLFKQSQFATLDNLRSAHRMIDGLRADGGTEMFGALSFALNQAAEDTFLRQIIFITDGSIGNETQLFKLIQQNLGDARLFTVGIGSAPNTHFMNKAAQFGRGSYTYINQLNQVDERMGELFSKINRPVLRDISVNWQQNVEHYPSRIPDLYTGEPLVLLFKSQQPVEELSLQGRLFDQHWQQSVILPKKNKSTENLDTLWARQKVASLMDQLATQEKTIDQIKPEIIQLGINHNLITKFTSFVAVETTPSKPIDKVSKNKNVPNLMPKGSTMPAPQTATPADLFKLIGLLLLMFTWVTHQYTLRKQTNA